MENKRHAKRRTRSESAKNPKRDHGAIAARRTRNDFDRQGKGVAVKVCNRGEGGNRIQAMAFTPLHGCGRQFRYRAPFPWTGMEKGPGNPEPFEIKTWPERSSYRFGPVYRYLGRTMGTPLPPRASLRSYTIWPAMPTQRDRPKSTV
jgi:hypothetical protein